MLTRLFDDGNNQLLDMAPSTQLTLQASEDAAVELRKSLTTLRDAITLYREAQAQSTQYLQQIAGMLVQKELFADPMDSNDCYARALLSFSRTLGLLAEEHGRLGDSLRSKVEGPLSEFLSSGFISFDEAGIAFRETAKAHEKSITKYLGVSKKKDLEKGSVDIQREVAQRRERAHEASLEYALQMQLLLSRRDAILVAPVASCCEAHTVFLQSAQQLLTEDTQRHQAAVSARLTSDAAQAVALERSLRQAGNLTRYQSLLHYHPDPDIRDTSLEFSVPSARTRLTSLSGYLALRQARGGGLTHVWTRLFCVAEDTALCYENSAGARKLLVELYGAELREVECDDRRHVFALTSPDLKQDLILQAEGSRQLTEWICTLENIARNIGVRAVTPGMPSVYFKARERPNSLDSIDPVLFTDTPVPAAWTSDELGAVHLTLGVPPEPTNRISLSDVNDSHSNSFSEGNVAATLSGQARQPSFKSRAPTRPPPAVPRTSLPSRTPPARPAPSAPTRAAPRLSDGDSGSSSSIGGSGSARAPRVNPFSPTPQSPPPAPAPRRQSDARQSPPPPPLTAAPRILVEEDKQASSGEVGTTGGLPAAAAPTPGSGSLSPPRKPGAADDVLSDLSDAEAEDAQPLA
eukprot:m.43687 g.43687  ORF g.43687 m.43687 type:complete len:635 (-) comp12248_c0_seq1:79-1983(-)